jgi:hypothetical protein
MNPAQPITRVWHVAQFVMRKVLVVASKVVGIEVNADKTKYMVISRD